MQSVRFVWDHGVLGSLYPFDYVRPGVDESQAGGEMAWPLPAVERDT